MKRFSGFLILAFGLLALILFMSSALDDYFIPSINLKNMGEVPPRNVVLYQKEGSFVINKNGSVNFYEPALLYCVSKTGTPFSIGNLVSDSNGVLNTVEVNGYLEMKGKKLDCGFKSMSDRPVAYSVFLSLDSSGLMVFGVMFSVFFLLLIMSLGFTLMCLGKLSE